MFNNLNIIIITRHTTSACDTLHEINFRKRVPSDIIPLNYVILSFHVII
jgi:hypothetical protein